MRRHDRRFNPQLSLVRHGCFPFRTDRRADSADRRVAENVNPVATAFRSIEPPAARAEAQDPSGANMAAPPGRNSHDSVTRVPSSTAVNV